MHTSNDEDVFLKVAQELADKRVDEALWTKAYALENGDERKTKAHYIRLRVEQLKNTQSKTQQGKAQDTSEHSRNEQDYVVESSNKVKVLGFVPATAWQRFWARSIDLLICTILVQFIPLKDELLSNIWLVVIVGFLLSGVVLVIYDGLLTSVFGATIGKLIAGLRVQKVDGSYPDFGLALRRAFNVLVSGNWLYTFYPISQLFLWPRLYKEFKKTGTTTWDKKAGTVVVQVSLDKTRDLIVAIVGLICLCSTLLVFQIIKQLNKSYIREVATDKTKISGTNDTRSVASSPSKDFPNESSHEPTGKPHVLENRGLQAQRDHQVNLLEIPKDAGLIATVNGISKNGELDVTIDNLSADWVGLQVTVTIVDTKQHVDVLNGIRMQPAYSESYSADISVLPYKTQIAKIQTRWDYDRGYMVSNISVFGIKKVR